MVDNSVLKVDDKTYLVVDTIWDNGNKYVYFLNENDKEDFFVRKERKENDQNYLVGLENDEEFVRAMELFHEKNK